MAILKDLNLNPDVEEAGDGTFKVVPGGKYQIVIVKDELKQNSKKTGTVLHVRVQITKGKEVGFELMDYWNLTNPDETCANIGQGTFKKVCNLCNVDFKAATEDTTRLYGKPMTAMIEQKDNEYNGEIRKQNNIKGYSKVETAQAANVASDDDDGNWV